LPCLEMPKPGWGQTGDAGKGEDVGEGEQRSHAAQMTKDRGGILNSGKGGRKGQLSRPEKKLGGGGRRFSFGKKRLGRHLVHEKILKKQVIHLFLRGGGRPSSVGPLVKA